MEAPREAHAEHVAESSPRTEPAEIDLANAPAWSAPERPAEPSYRSEPVYRDEAREAAEPAGSSDSAGAGSDERQAS
jgi:hypothetical protein